MALNKFEKDMQIIQALDDEPNDVGGLTAAELKAKYDEGGEAVKAFLNDVLLPALDTYIARTDNPHAVTKAQVGLGAADNTADANKPVSGPQQAALDLLATKAELQSVVLGQIPDASLTMAKMAQDVTATLAGKVDAESALKSTGENPTNFKLNQVARIINEDARFPVNYGTYVCARSSKDNTGGCYALHLYYGGDYLWFQQTSELNEITLAGWHKLTTAMPPTEDDLTLADGVNANGVCKYAKTQNGIVIIYGSVTVPTSAGVGKAIASLPAEYRPSDTIQLPISANTGAGEMSIHANGQIDISTVNDSMYTFICALFVAGN